MNRESIKIESRIIASNTEELWNIAASKGIAKYHPSLGIFKSILAEIENPNANKVRLGKKATEEAVSTLIGCQINKNHSVRDPNPQVLGHVIDASIVGNDIEIVCIFFKDIYAEEWKKANELFSENNLTVSFELSADVQSQDKLSDGTKRLNDFYFTGAGLLFGVAPACKKARVFEMATKNLYNQLAVERQSLIFANNQNTKKTIMGVLIKVTKKAEEIKAEELEQEKTAEVIDKATEVKAEEVKVEEVKAEEPKAEIKAEEPKAEAPVVEEPKAEEPVVEVKAEEPIVEEVKVIADAPMDTTVQQDTTPTTTVTEDNEKTTVTSDPVNQTVTVKEEKTLTVTEDDVKKVEQTQVTETMYTMAQVDAIKAEYEQKLAAKDAEIVQIKETANKLASIKLELSSNDFAKDFTDADYLDDMKVENAKLKFEAKKNETIVAKKKEEVPLSTGHKKFVASDSNESSLVALMRNKKANKK